MNVSFFINKIFYPVQIALNKETKPKIVNVYVSCFQALFSSRQPFILRKLEAKALSSSPYRMPSGGPLLQWWALINIINFF